MSYQNQKVQLPPSELGENRCFEAEYTFHGDLMMRTWSGEIDEISPDPGDVHDEKRFGMAHGSDVHMIAAFIGYYNRLGVDPEETSEVFRTAAGDILNDELRPHYYNPEEHNLSQLAEGSSFIRYDIVSLNLDCLMPLMPVHPGRFERTGGTGLYTKTQELGQLALVFVSFGQKDKDDPDSLPIRETAKFCKSDIPLMAQTICALSLGDYREQIQHLITDQFQDKT